MKIIQEKGIAHSQTHDSKTGATKSFAVAVKKSAFIISIDLEGCPVPSKINCFLDYECTNKLSNSGRGPRSAEHNNNNKSDLSSMMNWTTSVVEDILNIEFRFHLLSSQHDGKMFQVTIQLGSRSLVSSPIQILSKASVFEKHIQKSEALIGKAKPLSKKARSAMPKMEKRKLPDQWESIANNTSNSTINNNSLSGDSSNQFMLFQPLLSLQKQILEEQRAQSFLLQNVSGVSLKQATSFEQCFENLVFAWERLPQEQRVLKARKVCKESKIPAITAMLEGLQEGLKNPPPAEPQPLPIQQPAPSCAKSSEPSTLGLSRSLRLSTTDLLRNSDNLSFRDILRTSGDHNFNLRTSEFLRNSNSIDHCSFYQSFKAENSKSLFDFIPLEASQTGQTENLLKELFETREED